MTVAEIARKRGLLGSPGRHGRADGRIFANEISEENLAALDRLKKERALDNLTVVRGATADPETARPGRTESR